MRLDKVLLAGLLVLIVSCGKRTETAQPSSSLSEITKDFVYGTLELSPVAATGSGLHEYKGVRLDEQLDDLSEAGLSKQRQFFQAIRARLDALDRRSLTPQDSADYEIMSDQVALNLLELDTIQNYKHNPTFYVELIGNALFSPYVLEYAPLEQRWKHIIARMEKIPTFLESARQNLKDAPEVWNRVAREENDGNIGLIDGTFAKSVPATLQPSFQAAAKTALPALKNFNDWLTKNLPAGQTDWRLGKERYALKFRYALGLQQTPEQLLNDAEKSLESTRQRMFEIAKPLLAKLDPAFKKDAPLNDTVSAALRKVAEKHATPKTYFSDARRDLEEARIFVREKKLLLLPPRDNLQVIETPEFMRGIYGVGGFNSAPPLEPHLGAFYWITPIPENWPAARIESKLREYNYYGLKLLTIHEAMPGHYVQLEYANDVQPIERRLLRTVFGSGPYAEGWAVYATDMMLQQGYLNNSPELQLTFLKQQLRMIANTILDVRMQTMSMTDEEAMSLMLDRTFQEKEEATAKLQRAKLSSTQLPTYYAGYRDWLRVRTEDETRRGSAFTLSSFHEKALRFGTVPMRVLASLMAVPENLVK